MKADIRKIIKGPSDSGEENLHSDEVGSVTVISGLWVILLGFLFILGTILYAAFTNPTTADTFFVTLLILVLGLVLFPFLWLAVTIAFSVFTAGGFFKKRHFTLVSIDRNNAVFDSKLLMAVVLRGGAVNTHVEDPEFNDWLQRAVRFYTRITALRLIAVALGFVWAFLELDQRFDVFHLVYQLDLLPLRYVMVAIYIPLLFIGAWLVLGVKRHYAEGDLVIHRLKASSSRLDPDIPLTETPSDFAFDSGSDSFESG